MLVDMLVKMNLGFLGIALLFYCVLAGADFGAGILEAFRGGRLKNEQRNLIGHAIGPVWEANHVWLILAVVILFVGFPKTYALLSVSFHIPITLMLAGIILRGCAFTFRQYDVVRDRSQNVYSAIFVVSSFATPLMLGTLAGALLLGRFVGSPSGFADTYVWPWLNLFSLSVGVFTCALFAFLAGVYLTGESRNPQLRALFTRRALQASWVALVMGLAVFLSADYSGLALRSKFLSNTLALGCMGMASVLWIPLWWSLRRGQKLLPRLCAASQMGFILLGWFSIQAHEFLALSDPAPDATLRSLLYALVTGAALIFPALYFLFRVFKR